MSEHRLSCRPPVSVIARTGPWRVMLVSLLALLYTAPLAADDAGEIQVRDAHAWSSEDAYLLDASFDIELSSGAREALENGVPLTFELQLQLVRKHKWLWDSIEVEHVRVRELQYHALSRTYQLRDLNEGTQTNYSRLDDALLAAGIIDSLLLTGESLESDHNYVIRLRGSLDIESLPTPVRLLAYVSGGWDMNSEWYTWPLAR